MTSTSSSHSALNSSSIKILIASDHAGVSLKASLQKSLPEYQWIDLGPMDTSRVDYPDYAALAGKKLVAGEAPLAVLICGSGIGMSIAANKVHGIRAALVENPVGAQLAKLHNDANVLCLGARFLAPEYATDITRAFLEASFSGDERHANRIIKMMAIES